MSRILAYAFEDFLNKLSTYVIDLILYSETRKDD